MIGTRVNTVFGPGTIENVLGPDSALVLLDLEPRLLCCWSSELGPTDAPSPNPIDRKVARLAARAAVAQGKPSGPMLLEDLAILRRVLDRIDATRYSYEYRTNLNV